ncbi:Short chain dehydrogenase citE [Pseudocercospora fuligena]|uniref:Short chain dehydrogenase citE n=1 Tax=Pseudocercospora fuligena TaxID=685502 RepID=A0A8H6VJT4_9PEZI|nr:Short chain dehydrogenase citE [Pseudocercospora fuligena]
MASKQNAAPFSFPSFTKTWHSSPYEFISPSRPELSARGKNVVVTGGGTGIGKAIAIAFAQAGASSVAIIGRREDRLKTAVQEISEAAGQLQTKVIFEVADLTKRDVTTAALHRIVEKQGGTIEIFVSNAGATPSPGLALKSNDDDFMKLFDMNIRSTLNAIHAFVPHASENAVLINVSTGLAHMLPRAGISAHAASKAASLKLVDYIQVENPQLHVVSIQPGSVKTEATQNMKVQGKDDANLPGYFCVWLASKEAQFLKGKFVWANWDAQELIERAEEIKKSRLLTVMLEGMDM